MPLNARPLLRAARLQPSSIARRPSHVPRVFYSSGGPLPGGTRGEPTGDSAQKTPIGPYYEQILNTPPPLSDPKVEEPPTSSQKSPKNKKNNTTTGKKQPKDEKAEATKNNEAAAAATTPASSPTPSPAPTSTAAPSAEPATAQEKARIIFGSRLAGPAQRAERLAALRDRSTTVAGVLVPPRPDEPDNCCMSGCVNCVWERYRDEVEEWAAATARAEEARAVLAAQQQQQQQQQQARANANANVATSMDDDGGGSETSWQHNLEELRKASRPKIAKDLWDDSLYSNVPVGIREFMKQEKKLKEKHQREGTFGA
ncbi:oxidoreductase-like protein [Xylariaceae sp. FL0804]|nr:oxidoreductase-like protein [Xylariaceae sp. FL0804]